MQIFVPWCGLISCVINTSKSLTLETKAQLLLLVGNVAADSAHQRHSNRTSDPRNGAHFCSGICKHTNDI